MNWSVEVIFLKTGKISTKVGKFAGFKSIFWLLVGISCQKNSITGIADKAANFCGFSSKYTLLRHRVQNPSSDLGKAILSRFATNQLANVNLLYWLFGIV